MRNPLSALLVFLLLTPFLPQTLPCAADPASDENAVNVPIERMVTRGRSNRTPYMAIVKPHAGGEVVSDVWVPLELLNDMNCGVKLSSAKDRFTARVPDAARALGVPELERFLPDGAIELEFPAKSRDMGFYFNMTGMERITGVNAALTDAKRKPVSPDAASMLVVGKIPLMEGISNEAPLSAKPAYIPSGGSPGSPFSLIWDHVISGNADLASENALPTVKVISPTWFALADEDGSVSNRGELSYSRAAHARGYRVWALVSNGFKRDRTKNFLAHVSRQKAFIARMLAYAQLYELDGINVDFENVGNDDAARLTSFVKRLADAARSAGLSVTIDIAVPSKWSAAYERARLGKIVDYVAVMTYDEHWGSSPRAGSVASIPWVRAGLERTLAEIPASKLLLGVPLYTREWEEQSAKGKNRVRSKTMTMASVDQRMEETGAEAEWLPGTGQNYFQYTSGDKLYRIWVEDERSIALRLELVKRHNLAGAAFWRKGFEKPELWDQIEKSMKP
jgi:spore germination protein YaaH